MAKGGLSAAAAAASSAALSSRQQASAAIEAAHQNILRKLPQGILPTFQDASTRSRSGVAAVAAAATASSVWGTRPWWQELLDPPLPPWLAPVPAFCRLIAGLIIAPIILIGLTDFAGYAIFRSLGFRRRRVRVKEIDAMRGKPSKEGSRSTPLTPTSEAQKDAMIASAFSMKAPLLSPGAYDAETLLRHRARSISGDSVEAEEEWKRTGGHFARVSTVRAAAEAAAAAAAATNPTSDAAVASTTNQNDDGDDADDTALPHSFSTAAHAHGDFFARANDVGVEGAMGYSDTDADDSGPESGRNSPEMGRKPWRRGLTNSSFSFTPVSPTLSQTDQGAARGGLGVYSDPNSPAPDERR